MYESSNLASKEIAVASLLLCSVLFFVMMFFFYPTYHSADDNYLLYELSGALGNAPTNLLHYDYTWHPYLTYFLKNLFESFPGTNWYSVSLYFLHFISWFFLASTFFRRFSLKLGLIVTLLLFAVFGSHFLLRITYTNTSILLILAALINLGAKAFLRKKVALYHCIAPIVLFVVAGMVRIHIVIPFAALFLALLPLVYRRNVAFTVSVFLISLSSLFILNIIHKDYYQRHIPAWATKEMYRHAVLSFDNQFKATDTSGLSPKGILQNQWLKNGVLLDTAFLNQADILSIVQRKKGARGWASLKNEVYWMFINNRLFMVTAAGVAFFALAMSDTSFKRKVIIILQLLALMATCTYLLLFMKLPYYFIPATLFFYCLCGMLLVNPTYGNVSFSALRKYLFSLFWLGCVTWTGIRLYKINKENIDGQRAFYNAWEEIHRNKDKLFIAPYHSIPFDDLGVFISPLEYPLSNVVFKNSLMNHAHENTYKRFGIQTPRDLFLKNNIRFIGGTAYLIQAYYTFSYGQKLDSVRPAEDYRNLLVTELRAR